MGSLKGGCVLAAALALSIVLLRPGGAAEDANVAGTWEITVRSTQGTGRPTIILRQDGSHLTGTYRGRMGESALEGTIRENHIRFSVTLKFQDQPISVTYDGTVDQETMRGTAQFGDDGAADWSAKRKP